jgi:hypothetical protein
LTGSVPYQSSLIVQALTRQFDFYGDKPVVVKAVSLPNARIAKEVFYIPALLLLGLVIAMQRRRQIVPAFFGSMPAMKKSAG